MPTCSTTSASMAAHLHLTRDPSIQTRSITVQTTSLQISAAISPIKTPSSPRHSCAIAPPRSASTNYAPASIRARPVALAAAAISPRLHSAPPPTPPTQILNQRKSIPRASPEPPPSPDRRHPMPSNHHTRRSSTPPSTTVSTSTAPQLLPPRLSPVVLPSTPPGLVPPAWASWISPNLAHLRTLPTGLRPPPPLLHRAHPFSRPPAPLAHQALACLLPPLAPIQTSFLACSQMVEIAPAPSQHSPVPAAAPEPSKNSYA